jgi:hypothetical protein
MSREQSRFAVAVAKELCSREAVTRGTADFTALLGKVVVCRKTTL